MPVAREPISSQIVEGSVTEDEPEDVVEGVVEDVVEVIVEDVVEEEVPPIDNATLFTKHLPVLGKTPMSKPYVLTCSVLRAPYGMRRFRPYQKFNYPAWRHLRRPA